MKGKTLKSIVKQKIDKISYNPNDDTWGNASILLEVDLYTLSRSHLIKHLVARNEDTKGNKKKLIALLQESLDEEIARGIAYAKELEVKHRQIATL